MVTTLSKNAVVDAVMVVTLVGVPFSGIGVVILCWTTLPQPEWMDATWYYLYCW